MCACVRGGGSEGIKLWGVDMNRSRSFSLGSHEGVIRAICRSKVGVCTLSW